MPIFNSNLQFSKFQENFFQALDSMIEISILNFQNFSNSKFQSLQVSKSQNFKCQFQKFQVSEVKSFSRKWTHFQLKLFW